MHIFSFTRTHLLGLVFLSIASLNAGTPSRYQSSMIFPASLTSLPTVRMYYGGNKLVTEQRDHAITFSIARERGLSQLYILVTQAIEPIRVPSKKEGEKNNTVDHLSVPEGQAYKFYQVARETKDDGTSTWRVKQELVLNEDRYVPDNTIIVLWSPACIAGLEGGSEWNLPNVVCKTDTVSLFGSEQDLHDFATRTLLEAMNSDLFHRPSAPEKVKLAAGNRILRTAV